MNLESFLLSADKEVEYMVLSRMLTVRRMPPDLHSDLFTGREKELFDAMSIQWSTRSQIDLPLLKKDHFITIRDILQYQGTYSEHAVEILNHHWANRRLGEMIGSLEYRTNPESAIHKIQNEISDIAFKKNIDEYNHQNEIDQVMKLVDRGMAEKRETAGYSTGITELDKTISGIEIGKMYAIGGLKKTGKSRLAVYLSMRIIEQGGSVMWDSGEMNRTQLNSLATAYYSGVDSRKFGRCIDTDDYDKIQMAKDAVKNLSWCIYRDLTVRDLKSRILYERQKRKIEIVFVDFWQLMRDPRHRAGERTKELSDIAVDLANLSRDINVGVVVLSQLSGEAERLKSNEMPNMSYQKESQGLAEAADANLTIHNPDRRENPYTETGNYKLQEIYCLVEQRYDTSGIKFKMYGDMRYCHFTNHENPYGTD